MFRSKGIPNSRWNSRLLYRPNRPWMKYTSSFLSQSRKFSI
jgi:hypothetical protein